MKDTLGRSDLLNTVCSSKENSKLNNNQQGINLEKNKCWFRHLSS